MTTYNQARYRYINWLDNRILDAGELNRLQQIAHGVASDKVTPWSWELGAVYEEGATLNIAASIAGSTVTLVPVDNTKPMQVFVRGCFEILQAAEAPAITLTAGQTHLYLNWWLVIRDNTVDPSLVDAGSGEPTAQMGELVLQVSAADNSATALDTTQYFEKNTSPLVLFTFTAPGGVLALSSSTSVRAQALASGTRAGLVKLTTGTSSGTAVASDDPSVTNSRTPSLASVTDIAVRTPVLDGTGKVQPVGTGAGQDPGGITSAKVVHLPTSQLVSAVIESIRAQANATQTELANHEPKALGKGVHIMPSATDVGAAPLSHVGQPLGLSTSHRPEVDADSGGFQVVRNPGAPAIAMDPAFSVVMSGVLQSGLLHNGDVYSKASSTTQAYPNAIDGDGAQPTKSLGLLSVLASVVAGHVNKTSHNNPHGLTAGDIGFSVSTVNGGHVINLFGVIIQIFTGSNDLAANGRGAFTEVFPQAFPNNLWGVFPAVKFDTPVNTTNWEGAAIYANPDSTLQHASLYHDVRSDGSADSAYKAWIIAIGN